MLLAVAVVVAAACAQLTGPAVARSVPSADVVLSVTTTPSDPTTLEPLTYAIMIRNAGPSTAYGSVVDAYLVSDAIDVNSSEGTTCALWSARHVRCSAGDLAKDDSATALVSIQPGAAGEYVADFYGWSRVSDPQEGNDQLTVKTMVHWGNGLPASCSGQAAVASVDAGSQWCLRGFRLTEPRRLTIGLLPGGDFTGDLTAEIKGIAGSKVAATYVVGELATGQESIEVDLPAGDWLLVVRGGRGFLTTPGMICINPVYGCYAPFPWPTITLPARVTVYGAMGTYGAQVVAS